MESKEENSANLSAADINKIGQQRRFKKDSIIYGIPVKNSSKKAFATNMGTLDASSANANLALQRSQ
jgi:hypothetical protein